MSVASEPYRTLNWSSRRSASLPRRTGLRQRHHYRDLSPYRSVFPAVTTLPSSFRSYTSSARGASPKPSAVDTKLRDAQKLGNNYHITLNVNALLNDPPVRMTSNEAATSADYMMLRSSSSSVSGYDPTQQIRRTAMNGGGGGGGRRSVARMSVGDDQEVINGGHHQLQLATGRRRSRLTNDDDDDDGYVIQSVTASSSSNRRPQSVQHQDDGFVIRAVTPSAAVVSAQREPNEDDNKVSFDLQLIGLDSSNAKNQQTSYIVKEAQMQASSQRVLHKTTAAEQRQTTQDDVEPMYTMTIDETMTMDYYQPEIPTAAAVDRRSVAKQAKSSMPIPLPSRSKDHAQYEKEEKRRISVQQPPSASSSAGAPKSATRATHRKRPIPAKKDMEEPRQAAQKAGTPSSDAHGSIIIDRSSNAEQWKRMRNVKDGSNEGFVVAEESLKAQNDFRRPRPDLFGQGLKSTSSQRSNAAFDESDGRTAALVQSEALTRTGRASGRIEGGSDEDFHTEIKVSRGTTRAETRGTHVPWHTGGRTMASSPMGLGRDQQRSGSSTMSSSYVRRLMKDAPQGSVRQRMDIEEEEEVIGPFGDKEAAVNAFSSSADETSTHNLLNADLVSEKVDVKLEDGLAHLVVKVTCERLVPIHGSAHMYKKSSITVSRIVDVDLTVTGERRRIYDQVMENSLPSGKLSNRDTFELYMAFMELAELHPSAEMDQQQLWIDKKVDEEKVSNYASLENQLGDNNGSMSGGVKFTEASEKIRLVRSPNTGFTHKSMSYGAHELSPLSTKLATSGPQMYLKRSFDDTPPAGQRSMAKLE